MARQMAGPICCITFLSWCPWSEVGIVDGLVGLINFDWAISIFRWLCRWPGALIGQLGKRWVNGWVFFDLGWFSIASGYGIGASPHNRSGGLVTWSELAVYPEASHSAQRWNLASSEPPGWPGDFRRNGRDRIVYGGVFPVAWPHRANWTGRPVNCARAGRRAGAVARAPGAPAGAVGSRVKSGGSAGNQQSTGRISERKISVKWKVALWEFIKMFKS